MNATVSSALIWVAPAGGVRARPPGPTWGSFSILPIILLMLAITSGSVTFAPPVVAKTICSVSPESLGADACSSLMASDDSVLGKVNEFE